MKLMSQLKFSKEESEKQLFEALLYAGRQSCEKGERYVEIMSHIDKIAQKKSKEIKKIITAFEAIIWMNGYNPEIVAQVDNFIKGVNK